MNMALKYERLPMREKNDIFASLKFGCCGSSTCTQRVYLSRA